MNHPLSLHRHEFSVLAFLREIFLFITLSKLCLDPQWYLHLSTVSLEQKFYGAISPSVLVCYRGVWISNIN